MRKTIFALIFLLLYPSLALAWQSDGSSFLSSSVSVGGQYPIGDTGRCSNGQPPVYNSTSKNFPCTTLPVVGGGTGATSASAAFNALSPMTTSGDIIYGGASGAGTRLAKGTDGQVLTLASGLPSWATPSGGGSQTPWTSNIDADGFSLLVDDSTGIFSSESGNPELLKFTSVASAVNEFNITNAATGGGPILSATGGDTNIPVNINPKGSGNIILGLTNDTNLLVFGAADSDHPAFLPLANVLSKPSIGLFNGGLSNFGLLKLAILYHGPEQIVIDAASGHWSFLNGTETGFVPIKASVYMTSADTTGSGTVLGFGANSPAITVSGPYTWLKFESADGSTVWVPAYK